MVTLVTGADGFVGRHFLAAAAGMPLRLEGQPVDLRDARAVRVAVAQAVPDCVLHLAAQSHVPQSFLDPRETYEVNVIGTLNLLSALKDAGFAGRLLYVSTGDVYGRVAEADLPVCETRLPMPRNPYAASKLAAEALCYQWGQNEGLPVVIARPFNHVGAAQRPQFVLPDIARQLVSTRSSRITLTLGNVDVTRDYCDVADIVSAYELLLSHGVGGEVYNICSGIERSIRECALEMAAMMGLEIDFQIDPGRLRPAEQKRMAGSAEKIGRLGWRPCVPWPETLQRLLRYWKSQPDS